MSKPITQTIAETVVRLDELNAIVVRESAFNHWHFSGFPDVGLVQLFPVNRDLPMTTRQEHAKAVARAFGGEWERDLCDGSWRNCRGSFAVILHYVDKDRPRESRVIDLGATVPAMAEADDARDDEHHFAKD